MSTTRSIRVPDRSTTDLSKAGLRTVGISAKAKHELELFCAHNGVSMSGVVTELVLSYTDPRNQEGA